MLTTGIHSPFLKPPDGQPGYASFISRVIAPTPADKPRRFAHPPPQRKQTAIF